MDKLDKIDRMILKYLFILIVVVVGVLNYRAIFGFLGNLLSVISPILVGAALAYILNILMQFFERHLFPNATHQKLLNIKRPICIFLSILVIALVLIVVIRLVVPQLYSVFHEIIMIIPELAEQLRQWIIANEEIFPPIAGFVEQWDVNWQVMIQRTLNFINNLTGSVINTAFSTVTSLLSIVINFLLAIMIAIYILMTKEDLLANFDKVFETYLKPKHYHRLKYVTKVLDNSFYNFITGEVVEAIILGVMVTIGMIIFQFPYATMVGALTGVTALIPIVGAYLSGAVGFLLILMHSPVQALLFVLFIVVVQQIEGNLIYPNVVGDSIGLPGLWVLVAVTIGGGVGGILGMIIAVPLASAAYKMLKDNVKKRQDIDQNILKDANEYHEFLVE